MNIAELVQQSYVPVIVLFCLVIGYVIKKIEKIPDKYIPLIMLILGGISGVIVNGLSFTGVTYGMVSGVASTGFHQVFKQLIEGEDKDDTSSIME